MITRLTPEQEAELIQFRQKWFEIGTCCEPADQSRAEQAITAMYQLINAPGPAYFVWVDSPYQADLYFGIARTVETLLWTSLGASSWELLESQLKTSLNDSLWNSALDALEGSVVDFLVGAMKNSLEIPIENSLGALLRAALEPLLWAALKSSLAGSREGTLCASGDSLGESFAGQHEAPWLAVYLYAQELGVKYKARDAYALNLWAEIAQSCGWWWPRTTICIISDRPAETHWQGNRLHRDGGPAVRFRDGWCVWALNGMRVPKRVAETPAEQIPLEWWLNEENVEVRRQVERKIGKTRILKELAAQEIHREVVSIGGTDLPYAVLELTLKNGDKRRLLEMTNPSTGEVHQEWIPPDMATVWEVLAWRNGTEELPERIS